MSDEQSRSLRCSCSSLQKDMFDHHSSVVHSLTAGANKPNPFLRQRPNPGSNQASIVPAVRLHTAKCCTRLCSLHLRYSPFSLRVKAATWKSPRFLNHISFHGRASRRLRVPLFGKPKAPIRRYSSFILEGKKCDLFVLCPSFR